MGRLRIRSLAPRLLTILALDGPSLGMPRARGVPPKAHVDDVVAVVWHWRPGRLYEAPVTASRGHRIERAA